MFCAKVIEEFENPFHMGVLEDYTFLVHNTNSGCGDESHLYIVFDGERIADISFQAFGCASCLAVTSFLCRSVIHKSPHEIEKLDRAFVSEAFAELEPSQMHCIDMAMVLLEKITGELRGGRP